MKGNPGQRGVRWERLRFCFWASGSPLVLGSATRCFSSRGKGKGVAICTRGFSRFLPRIPGRSADFSPGKACARWCAMGSGAFIRNGSRPAASRWSMTNGDRWMKPCAGSSPGPSHENEEEAMDLELSKEILSDSNTLRSQGRIRGRAQWGLRRPSPRSGHLQQSGPVPATADRRRDAGQDPASRPVAPWAAAKRGPILFLRPDWLTGRAGGRPPLHRNEEERRGCRNRRNRLQQRRFRFKSPDRRCSEGSCPGRGAGTGPHLFVAGALPGNPVTGTGRQKPKALDRGAQQPQSLRQRRRRTF